jgi:hypothetical protein
MSISFAQRRVLHWVGSGLALMGILFVGFRLHSYWLELDSSRITPMDWGGIIALSIIYGAANLLLAMAWWHLLQLLGANVNRIVSIRIYGVSQLAKYLPGNIFHLAGRQALGLAENIAGWILIKSLAFELGIIAVGGSMFGWLILPLKWNEFQVSTGMFLQVGTCVLVSLMLAKLIGRHAMWAFVWQISFLLISGSVFVVLLNIISGPEAIFAKDSVTIGAAFIVAWLVGLVTPGAPAGVGIREIVMFFLLKTIVSESDLLLTILLSRIFTVFGDIWFYLAASLGLIDRIGLKKNE